MIRRGRVLAGAVALVTAVTTVAATVTLTATGQAAASVQRSPTAATTTATTEAASYRVTLITGDRVLATKGPTGTWKFGFEPAQARGPASANGPAGYHQFPARRGATTDWYVIPHSAAPLVRAAALDRELFNVTALIAQRYDDARSDALPLLLEYPDAAATERTAMPHGAKVERTLAGRNLAAVAERKTDAATFWRGLTAGGGTATALAGGPTKVWLNARFSASLDVSVPQIGAPAAWQRGHTGTGVTVAVLDTGADADHPDLAGRIAQSQDFTGSGSTRDGNGHGTHVASTIAGSGAASTGRYQGVAPDARLAVGKVLDDTGSGQLDDILAGMEWAARDARAKVVNLSLGAGPTDGTDPASRAVNDLTRQYGTLFVIAAGNYGSDGTVSTPATADAALAVGSVTKTGELSEFSSRGPRSIDGAVKPEIAAPGSDIVAARAEGTQLGEPVGEHHVRLSGTSMATPHTAGAAAILAGQHPDWGADRLKAALVGSAAPVAGAGVFAVGGGRVDLDRATGQTVTAAPATVNGYLEWPERRRQRHTVTYRNDSTAPLTLALRLELTDAAGQAPPTGLARLSTSTITVPAGRTASVALTLTPRSGRPGVYGGTLTATTADSAVRLRTPVAVHDEPERYDLTFDVRNRDGAAPGPNDSATVMVINLDNGDWHFAAPGERLRLAPGRYSVGGHVATPRVGTWPSLSMLAHPELRLQRDTTITLDARQARRVTVSTDQPAARGGFWTARFQMWPSGQDYPFASLYLLEPRFDEVYAHSTPGVSSPAFGYANNLRLEEPDVELFAEPPAGSQRFEVPAGWFHTSPRPDGTQRRDAVHGGAGRPEDLAGLDVRDKLVVLDLPESTSYEEAFERIRNVAGAGGAMVALNITFASALAAHAVRPAEDNPVVLPTVVVYDVLGQRFSDVVRVGGARSTFTARSASAYRYELSFPAPGAVPDQLSYAVRTADLAAVRMAYHGYPLDAPPSGGAWVEALGTEIGTQWYVPVPAQRERVEHFTPGTWDVQLAQIFGDEETGPLFTELNEVIRLEGGREYQIRWNATVIGPGFAGTTSDELGLDHPWACRVGNLLNVNLPLHSDAAGHSRPAIHEFAVDVGSTRLERDGQLLGSTGLPGRGLFFTVPNDDAEYRLTADVTRDHPWWPTSTRVDGSWTFHMPFRQGPSCEPLPLLAVRFAPAVDLRNAAPGGREFSFPVSVLRQDGPAEITALELEISYDDGATWQPASLARDGDAWRATVTHPASGFASLRASAADADGNTVTQTIIRAYQLG